MDKSDVQIQATGLIDGSIEYYSMCMQISQILRNLEVYEKDPTVKILILKVKKNCIKKHFI